MYQKQKAGSQADASTDVPTEPMMRDEIQRVANTLIKLMEFTT